MKKVLISKGYGEPWSSGEDPEIMKKLCMDEELIKYIEDHKISYNFFIPSPNDGINVDDDLKAIFKRITGDEISYVDILGLIGLEVEKIDDDIEFYIDDYDGQEFIVYRDDKVWIK